MNSEARRVAADKVALGRGERPGESTMLTCPDCGGVLWKLRHGDQLQFRCHVGHTYTAEALRVQQFEERAQDYAERADTVRNVLSDMAAPPVLSQAGE